MSKKHKKKSSSKSKRTKTASVATATGEKSKLQGNVERMLDIAQNKLNDMTVNKPERIRSKSYFFEGVLLIVITMFAAQLVHETIFWAFAMAMIFIPVVEMIIRYFLSKKGKVVFSFKPVKGNKIVIVYYITVILSLIFMLEKVMGWAR